MTRLIQSMLFKYLKADHANQLLNLGVLRIGTLYEFRSVETHGGYIGDQDEGTLTYQLIPPEEGLSFSADNQPEFLKPTFALKEGARLTIQADAIRRRENAPDCYVFCATTKLDASLMDRFGYDTCVEIFQPADFFRELSACSRELFDFQGVHHCIYSDRLRNHFDVAR